jgi:hypothetical protein
MQRAFPQVRFASDAADPFVHLELPLGVDLTHSPRPRRTAAICAFPPSAAASSARLEALQSRSLALVSLPRNVMRGGFHRSEALILSLLSKGAPRQGARRGSGPPRNRRVVARGERAGSFCVDPAHAPSSRPPQARFAVRDDSVVRGDDRDAHSQGVAAPRRTHGPDSNTKGSVLLPRRQPCAAQRLDSSRLGQRVTADREHG